MIPMSDRPRVYCQTRAMWGEEFNWDGRGSAAHMMVFDPFRLFGHSALEQHGSGGEGSGESMLVQFSYNDILVIDGILARAAETEIMPRFRRISDSAVREKSSAFDVVTDADEAAERAIAVELRSIFPNALVVGEEATEKDPALLGAIATGDLAFIVDPIDGTKNFVAGLPLFGMMIAATFAGRSSAASYTTRYAEILLLPCGERERGCRVRIASGPG
jgi:Inositol monophosphatase family